MKSTFPLAPVALLLLGMLVFLMRNPDPILNPVLYTEDGLWIGKALTNGWLNLFFDAREQKDYFAWGNVLLLGLAFFVSWIFYGYNLSHLPIAIAVCSYAFFGMIATLAFYLTAGDISKKWRIAIYVLILLTPMGHSGNEVWGRISNIGYAFVFLAVLLLIWREQKLEQNLSFTKILLIDIALIFCLNTNPVGFLLVFFYLASRWLSSEFHWDKIRRDLVLFIGAMIFFIWIIIRYYQLTSGNAITGSIEFKNLFEVIVARTILYPFVFSFYYKLNIWTALTGLIIWLGLVYAAWRVDAKEHGRFFYLVGVALIINILLTIIMRPSLTQQLGDWKTTFPDRYFYGSGLIIVILTAFSLDRLIIKGIGSIKVFAVFVCFIIGIIYFFSLPRLFELKRPKMVIRTEPSFAEQVYFALDSVRNKSTVLPEVINVPIYFDGWSMALPLKYAVATADAVGMNSKIQTPFNYTDSNWVNGVARNWAGFFVSNSPLAKEEYEPGRLVRFVDGTQRVITQTQQNGPYLNIYLTGDPMDGNLVGFPNKITVTDLSEK